MEEEHTKEPSHNNPEEAAVNNLPKKFVNDIRVGCLREMLENFGWNGRGSIKLQQYSSTVSSWVSLSFSNLSSVGADKCGGIFNWMMGLTESFNTKVNCSGEDTLLLLLVTCGYVHLVGD